MALGDRSMNLHDRRAGGDNPRSVDRALDHHHHTAMGLPNLGLRRYSTLHGRFGFRMEDGEIPTHCPSRLPVPSWNLPHPSANFWDLPAENLPWTRTLETGEPMLSIPFQALNTSQGNEQE